MIDQLFTHTDGPWRIILREDQQAFDGRKVTVEAQTGIVADVTFGFNHGGENLANARLIAKAPDLLEFAVIVSRSACLDQKVGNRCVCFSCKAKELIGQANGQQPHLWDYAKL